MMQDLAALAPPAIVCAAFLVGAWAILRRELAPKRRARAQAAAAAGQASRGARGPRAGQKLTFRDICDLSRHTIRIRIAEMLCARARWACSLARPVRWSYRRNITAAVSLHTSRGPGRVICQVCAHCSIRHFTDTRRERSLRASPLQFPRGYLDVKKLRTPELCGSRPGYMFSIRKWLHRRRAESPWRRRYRCYWSTTSTVVRQLRP